MSAEIGELNVEQYLALASEAGRGNNNPLHLRATQRYGSHGAGTQACRRFTRLIEQFAARFGSDRRICLYEAPGRVNLMGMHIDHRGGIVNPVATKERICAVCSRRDDDLIHAVSLLRDLGESRFRISDRLPKTELRSLSQWLNWTESQAAAFDGGRDFINYFACGPLYAACFCYPWGRKFAGADILLDSDLPPSVGLSSSSAVVILATDFFLRCNPEGPETFSIPQRLPIYGYGEWYIGTRGGTGDHAAIKLSQRGAVQPLITTPGVQVLQPAPFPEGYDILLYQSGEEANKSVEPFKTRFNAPIISYQTAEMMLTEYVGQWKPECLQQLLANRASADPRHHRVYLGDVVNEDILSRAEIYRFLRSLPRVMNQAEIFLRLGEGPETFRAGLQQTNEPQQGYHVRDVAAFGFGECTRGRDAGRLLADGDVQGFAHMMNVSQLGDCVTEVADSVKRGIKFLRDDALSALEKGTFPLREIAGDYRVSTANVDRLVSLCLSCPHVLGARLSGAGLGGALIVLGKEGFDESLDPILRRDYYEPQNKDFQKIRIVPSEGAGFY